MAEHSGTWSGQVSDGADDGLWDASEAALVLDAVSVTVGTGDYALFRIPGVDVPPGARVTSAALEVNTVNYSNGRLQPRIILRPDVPQLDPQLIESVSAAADVIYDVSGTSSRDVAPLLEQVVSLPDWRAGNAVCFALDRAAGSTTVAARMFEGGLAYAARLTVQWELDFLADADLTIASGPRGATMTISNPRR